MSKPSSAKRDTNSLRYSVGNPWVLSGSDNNLETSCCAPNGVPLFMETHVY